MKTMMYSKKILFIIIINVLCLMLMTVLFVAMPNNTNIKAENYDFEIYFKVNGQSQIDIENLEESYRYNQAQGKYYLDVDMYLSALSASTLGVSTLGGSIYFDKSYFALTMQQQINTSVSTFEDPDWGGTYPSWADVIFNPVASFNDRAFISLGCNTSSGPYINIGQDFLVMRISFEVLQTPTENLNISWRFTDEHDPGQAVFRRNESGNYHEWCTVDEGGLIVDDSNILFTPFNIGDPESGEPSADLGSLSLKGGAVEYLTPAFDAGTTSYNTWQIPYADSVNGVVLDYSTLSSSAEATVSFSSGSVNIDANNIITGLTNGDEIYIDVSDNEGTLEKRYTIAVSVAEPSSNADLSNLTATSGGTNYPFTPTFHKDTLEYTLNLPYDRTQVTLNATKDDNLSTVKIDGQSVTSIIFTSLQVGSVTKTIEVTAEDSTTKTYTVHIVRAPASSNTELLSLTVNGNNIELSEGITEYSYFLNESTTNYTFIATRSESSQTLSYKIDDGIFNSGGSSGAPRGIQKNQSVLVTIRVIAQDGTTQDYLLTIQRAPSTNTGLSSVTVQEGSTTKTLTPQGDIYEYTLGTSGANNIIVTATGIIGENSTVTILDSSENIIADGIINIEGILAGTYQYIIRVTPQDIHTPPKNYTLRIIKKSEAKELYTPAIYHTDNNDNPIEGFVYDPVTFTYSINIPYSINDIAVNSIRILFGASANSSISSPGWADLKIGSPVGGEPRSFADISFAGSGPVVLTRDIIITAQDGSIQNYIVRITRGAANTDNSLETLLVGGNPVDGFAPGTLIYNTPIIFPGDTQTINIDGVPNSEFATVKYNGESIGQISLARGVLTTINISVTAQSGAVRTYTIKVIAANTDNSITNITLRDGSSNPISGLSFDPGNIGPYNISVPYTVSVVTLQATTPSGAYSILHGVGTFSLDVNTNTFTVYAVSEAGIKGLEYTINITRNPARTEKILDSLVISGSGIPNYISGFNSQITEYNIRVNRGVTSLKVEATVPLGNGSSIVSGLTDNFTWAGVSATIYVEVRAEDNSRQTYTINVTRANDNNTIDNIQVDLQTITFNPTIKTYALNPVNYSKQKATFNVTLQDTYAKLYVSVNGGELYLQNNISNFDLPLAVGNNTISLIAESEYGTRGDPYIFTVTRNIPSSNARLQSLEILAGGSDILVGENVFSPDKTQYTIRVDNNITSIIINAIKQDENAVMVITPTTRTLNLGSNTFNIEITAEDGTTQLTYEIVIVRANDINDIDDITINLEDFEYDAGTTSYSLSPQLYSINMATFGVTLRDSSAKLYVQVNLGAKRLETSPGSFDINLTVGLNTIRISAVSEYGTEGATYVFTVTRNNPSDNAKLQSLEILAGGNDILAGDNAFDPDKTEYTIRVNNNITSIIINAIKQGENAVMVITPSTRTLNLGSNTFNIVLTAEDGTTQLTYEIVIVRANDINDIDNITVNLEDFDYDAETTNYALAPQIYSINMATFGVTLRDSSAKLYVQVNSGAKRLETSLGSFDVNLAVGLNTIRISAVSEYGTEGATYVFTVTRNNPSDNAKLQSLEILAGGNDILVGENVFSPDKTFYRIRVDNVIDSIIINAVRQDSKAGMVITPSTRTLNLGNNTFNIVLTAEDGITQLTYEIIIVRANDNNDIDNIIINTEDIGFSPETQDYDLSSVAFSTKKINYRVTLSDASAKLYAVVNGSTSLIVNPANFDVTLSLGDNTIVIYAESQYGTKGVEYSFNVVQRPASNDAKLSSLEAIVGGNDILTGANTFDPDRLSYSVRVNNNLDSVNIITLANDANAQIVINPSTVGLANGKNTFYITVTAEAGNTRTYILEIYRANDNNNIQEIRVNGTLIPMNPDAPIELPEFPHSVKSLNITAIREDSSATLYGTGTKTLQDGTQYFEIYAISEYGLLTGVTKDDVPVYVIVVTRKPLSTDNKLEGLSVTDSGGEPLAFDNSVVFDPLRYSYTITLDSESTLSEVNILAVAQNNNKTVSGDIGAQTLIVNPNGTISSQFVVTVTAENGSEQNYTINIVKGVTLSNDFSIQSVTLRDSGGNNYLLFNPDAAGQADVNIPFNIEGLILTVTPNDSKAAVSGSYGYIAVNAGGNAFVQFKVVAENGMEGLTYSFYIYRAAPKTQNHLESLTVKDINDQDIDFLDGIFDSMTNTYSIRVDDIVERVVIEALLPQGNGSTIESVIAPSYLLQSGKTTTITIIVRAENGAFNSYTIQILRANNDNRIESIKIGDIVVPVEDFVKVAGSYEYTLTPNLIYSQTTIELQAILVGGEESKATISGDGIKSLSVGSNSFVIYATAQDGTVGDNYLVRVMRDPASSDALLKSLKVTGADAEDVLLEVLSNVANEYTLQVDRSYPEINILAVKNHAGARVSGDIGTISLTGGIINTLRIFVTAENDVVKTYTIRIDVRDDENDIQDIISTTGSMDFDSDQFTYNLGTVPYTANELSLAVLLSNQYAKLYINSNLIVNPSDIKLSLSVGVNTFVIYAESERGNRGSEYIITIEKEAADDNNYLAQLEVSGNGDVLSFEEGPFNKDILNYTVILAPDSSLKYITISAIAENGSVPQGLGLKELKEVSGVISNTFNILVTAENGDVRTYAITVIKSQSQIISDDNEIKDISLIGKGQEFLRDSFNPDVALQDAITVPYSIDALYLNLSVHEKARVTGAGLYNIGEGETITIQFQVTAENGSQGLLYEVEVTREYASEENILEELYYEIDGEKVYLDPSITEHIINIDNDIPSIIIGGLSPDKAIVQGFGEFELNDVTTTIIITVKAENGELTNYVIKIEKKNDDATIKSILLDSNNIIDNFINYVYEINVPYSKASVSIMATPNNSKAEITGNGNFALSVGLNEFLVYAKSEAGTQGAVYTIKINRQQANTNNNLSSLTVRDNATGDLLNLQPEFNSNTTKYTIDLTDFPAVQEILIEAVAQSSFIQKIEGTGTHILKTLAGESSELFKISVTAENGSRKEYDITIIRNVKPEDDVTVHALSFIGSDSVNYLGTGVGALNKFELTKKTYNITIPYSVKNATLTIINNNGAAVYGNGNYVFSSDRVIEFYLDSQSGNYSSGNYVIIVTIEEPSDDNTLSNLLIDGATIEGFDPDISNYELTVSYEDVSSIQIGAVASDKNATVIGDLGVINLTAGNNNINVTVKAEDGSTRTYTINVRRLSTDNRLLSLGVTGYTIAPLFQESIYEYTLTVPYSVEMVNVSATANPKAVITGIGHKSLAVGENAVIVYVTSEQGQRGENYLLTITREAPSSDNTLKSLTVLSGVDGQELVLQPIFRPEVTNYIIQLDEGSNINTMTIFAEANCSKARGVGGTGYKVLATIVDGKYHNVFEIIVMAEDNSTRIYTVSVYRDVQLADDVTIADVSLIGSDSVKYLGSKDALTAFNPNEYIYNIVVPYYVESVTLSIETLSATVYGVGQKNFSNSDQVIFSTYIVSQSGSVVSNTYTIRINRILPLDDNSLKYIRLNGQNIEGFSPDTTQYEISIPYLSTDKLIISAEPNNPTSVILSGTGSYDVIEGRNVFSILVRAENGDTRSYNLVINYMNNNSFLDNLSLQGSEYSYVDDKNAIPYQFTFIPDTFNYIITVDKNIQTVLLKGQAQDQERAAIIGLGRYALNNDRTTIVINVIAADNVTTSTYTINVVKTVMPSSNTRLKELHVDGYSLPFRPDNLTYSLSVGSKTENLDVSAITEDPNAKVTIMGSGYLEIGSNVILLKVEAEDGTVSYYQLSVKRNMEPDYFLAIMLILIFLMLIIIFLHRVINNNKDKINKKFKGFQINKTKSIDLNNLGREMKKWRS